MRLTICDDKRELGRQAALCGADEIRHCLKEKGSANVAFVTGLSQAETLKNLTTERDIDWKRVNIFFLDEYVGIAKNHKASSLNFLTEFFLKYIGEVASINTIRPDKDRVKSTLRDLNKLMESYPLDVAFICIGENGHLALNDPPANLDTKDAYILVELEKRSRRQQVGEGWFKTIDEVPTAAITMSIREVLSAKHIICSCPDQRKARAVAMTLFDDISPSSPCATLKRAENVDIFLDRQSSYLILGDRRQ